MGPTNKQLRKERSYIAGKLHSLAYFKLQLLKIVRFFVTFWCLGGRDVVKTFGLTSLLPSFTFNLKLFIYHKKTFHPYEDHLTKKKKFGRVK